MQVEKMISETWNASKTKVIELTDNKLTRFKKIIINTLSNWQKYSFPKMECKFKRTLLSIYLFRPYYVHISLYKFCPRLLTHFFAHISEISYQPNSWTSFWFRVANRVLHTIVFMNSCTGISFSCKHNLHEKIMIWYIDVIKTL